MGLNPMEKMKAAAAAKMEGLKDSALSKVSELKSAAADKIKEGAQTAGSAAGEAIKKGASDVIDELKNGPKPTEPVHITTAADFTGNLDCPVNVCLIDCFDKSAYANMEPEEEDDDEKEYKFTKNDLSPAISVCLSEDEVEVDEDDEEIDEELYCTQCKEKLGNYYTFVTTLDKKFESLISGDGNRRFCSEECCKKFFEEKYKLPVFVTADEDRFNYRQEAAKEFLKKGTSSALVNESDTNDSNCDNPDYSKYDKSDCCAECGTPFVIAGSYYDYIIESADKEQNKLINKDKEIQYKHFCSPECAQKFFEKKYPGVFVTEDRDEYDSRLMAGRKNLGNVSLGDKMAQRTADNMKKMESRNEMFQKKQEERAAKNKGGLLGMLFPFLNKFLK